MGKHTELIQNHTFYFFAPPLVISLVLISTQLVNDIYLSQQIEILHYSLYMMPELNTLGTNLYKS